MTSLSDAASVLQRTPMQKQYSSLRRVVCMAVLGLVVTAVAARGAAVPFSETPTFQQQGDTQIFGNGAISASWTFSGQKIGNVIVRDRLNHRQFIVNAPFLLTLKNGDSLSMGDLHTLAPPTEMTLPVDKTAARLAAHFRGNAVEATLGDSTGRFRVNWRLAQREGSNYLREIITVTALKHDESIRRVDLLQTAAADANVVGTVKGSPVVAGHDYFGFEQPLSHSAVSAGEIKLWMDQALPLRKSQSITFSAVVGVTHPGQLRRDFATYVERERAHPYRPFLHYNSWYDIGFNTPYTEAEALDRINAFGQELVRKRGVKLDSFLFDDGWDDLSGSWNFSKAFPRGFVPLRKAAAKYGAAPGVWLSPWGGYEAPKQERLKNGRAAGYEIIDGGFALSGPKYFRRFHHVVMNLLNTDGVNQFKFDGTGNVESVFPGSRFNSDFAAAISLIQDIRADKPNTFVNLTTGTWASPFWLRYADSIWRGGEDNWRAGVGTAREQWITYRDEQVYQNIVIKGPLFPINSLMLHGIIFAQMNTRLNTDPGHDFTNEVHSYFATGTDCQELYITPSLLSSHDWDVLAEAAKWSRANASVLRDTHWIGGDPGRLDVYGWASWSPSKSIITLRNPDDHPQQAVIDLQRQLELPSGATRQFIAHSPWRADAGKPAIILNAAHPRTITLAPFEVLTLELTPRSTVH
uniref:enterotoxin n=1 Tax=Rhodanobacter glycinis TaxID=582702 RepID=UPI001C0ECE29|nr:enterotoxin [Rhodanobacter glycinis]